MVDLKEYRQYVDDLRAYARDHGITEDETDKIFEECFRELEKQSVNKCHWLFKIIKITFGVVLCVIICAICLYNHPSTHNFCLRNIQDFIYPGMWIVRKLAVPIITRFPALTGNCNYILKTFFYTNFSN